jgi:AAA domain, putative AbiEii toxin, Type IV TA system
VIHVDRGRVRPPKALSDTRARTARDDAREFFSRPARSRRQLSFSFDPSVFAGPDVVDALGDLFMNKCAFCESAVGLTAPAQVVQLRPPQAALDLEGNMAPDHYWWLAYEWENLYLSCPQCARVRGTRFPVAATRARPDTKGPKLDNERPLLLDPCRDDPERHLLYLPDGTVVSDDERGRATCDMFDLNRSPLVEARRAAAAVLEDELAALMRRGKPGAELPRSAVEPLLDPAREFAGMRRQYVAERLGRVSATETVAPGVRIERPAVKRAVRAEFAQRQAAQEAFSLADPATEPAYFSHARLVERVEIRNFRVISELDIALDFDAIAATTGAGSPDERQRAPWLMLLGENGLGKSTVLQATCLALLDERSREALELDASTFVRNGTRRAVVRVHLTGASEPLELIARAGSRQFEGGGVQKTLLLGYGATRLLPTAKHRAPEPPSGSQGLARVENLFDPFMPIGDATSWLLSIGQREFDDVARGLRQLLMLADDERLVRDRKRGRVLAQVEGERVPIEELSAGYQSVIALATDVMKVVLRLWDTPAVAEGIVIVDELGAHLHPRWRMRIVEALRSVFPRVQFLTSTHDPLCLRGLADGEIVVLRKNSEGQVVALDDLPPPDSMRVDQLLASEHFGLGSTVDPALDELFAEYYILKAKRRPTARERKRRKELEAELEGKEMFGTTRRERLIYEATDMYLAREVDVTDRDDRERLRDETKERILAVWKGGP